MVNLRRLLAASALSVLIALTGQGLAASRGVNAAVGQMVLCTGTGPVVVYMDEAGQPARPPHFCPDYALSLIGALLPDDIPDRPIPVAKVPVPRPAVLMMQGSHTVSAHARAPPFAV